MVFMARIELHIIAPEKYFKGVLGIIKKQSKSSLIYVTTNKPYSVLVEDLKKNKINSDKIFFIDCISRHIQQKENDVHNCVFIDSPSSLTSISIAISDATAHFKGKKVLLLDSLSVLLIYNDANTIAKFSNFILNKMRSIDVDTVILALESDEGKDVLKQVESYADKVIGGK